MCTLWMELLSAKYLFLYEMRAQINFRNAEAVIPEVSEKSVTLERGPGGHLLLPITAFAGREHVMPISP